MFRKGALMLVCACSAAFATAGVIVTPGGAFLLPVEEADGHVTGIVDSRSEAFSITNALGEVRATGVAISQVYATTTGGLLFAYAVLNDASSLDGINRVTVTNFNGWTVEAGQDVANSGVGTQLASSVDRTAASGTIGFAFTAAPVGLGSIAPGDGSEFLWLKTSATTYRDGTLSVIDGGVDSVLSFAPGVVPEPASMAALAIGAAAMLRRRRK